MSDMVAQVRLCYIQVRPKFQASYGVGLQLAYQGLIDMADEMEFPIRNYAISM